MGRNYFFAAFFAAFFVAFFAVFFAAFFVAFFAIGILAHPLPSEIQLFPSAPAPVTDPLPPKRPRISPSMASRSNGLRR